LTGPLDWRTFFDPNPGVAVLIDPQVELDRGRGALRSIPLLHEMGLTTFTHTRPQLPYATHFYQPVPYQYVVLRPGEEKATFTRSHQLVQVVSQWSAVDFPVVEDLLSVALDTAGSGTLLLLVLGSLGFQVPGGDPDKSLIEDWRLRESGVSIRTYDQLFSRVKGALLPNSPLPEAISRNLWLHRLASELAAAGWTRTEQLTDLFDFGHTDYPLTPTIHLFLQWLLGHGDRVEQLENEGAEYVRKLLRPWMERGTGRGESRRVSDLIWWNCDLFDYDLDRLERSKGLHAR
jgi:hypothetical protein